MSATLVKLKEVIKKLETIRGISHKKCQVKKALVSTPAFCTCFLVSSLLSNVFLCYNKLKEKRSKHFYDQDRFKIQKQKNFFAD
jgi:hypothetical protein